MLAGNQLFIESAFCALRSAANFISFTTSDCDMVNLLLSKAVCPPTIRFNWEGGGWL